MSEVKMIEKELLKRFKEWWKKYEDEIDGLEVYDIAELAFVAGAMAEVNAKKEVKK